MFGVGVCKKGTGFGLSWEFGYLRMCSIKCNTYVLASIYLGLSIPITGSKKPLLDHSIEDASQLIVSP